MSKKDRDVYRIRLRSVGLRHTLPRERILAYLDRKNTHPTPEELFGGLRRKGYSIGLSTVYLNLQVLRDAGLVWEFKDQLGNTRYDGFSERHHHMVCLQSGRIEDISPKEVAQFIPDETIKRFLEGRTGWFIDEVRLEIRGISPEYQ